MIPTVKNAVRYRYQPSRAIIDPDKEWDRVKIAWNYDKAAWMRYSGFKPKEA